MTEFKRVFVDTAPIIYYLENSALYVDLIKKFFTKCLEENIQIVTSAITIEEYLVLPYVSGKVELADNFKRFIEYMNIKVVDIDSNIAEQGAKIRGKYKHFFLHVQRVSPSGLMTNANQVHSQNRQLFR